MKRDNGEIDTFKLIQLKNKAIEILLLRGNDWYA